MGVATSQWRTVLLLPFSSHTWSSWYFVRYAGWYVSRLSSREWGGEGQCLFLPVLQTHLFLLPCLFLLCVCHSSCVEHYYNCSHCTIKNNILTIYQRCHCLQLLYLLYKRNNVHTRLAVVLSVSKGLPVPTPLDAWPIIRHPSLAVSYHQRLNR